jgi:hypothetical protein
MHCQLPTVSNLVASADWDQQATADLHQKSKESWLEAPGVEMIPTDTKKIPQSSADMIVEDCRYVR